MSLLGGADAAAQSPSQGLAATPDAAIRWPSEHLSRVQIWEYIAGPVLIGTAFSLRFAGPGPSIDFRSGTDFDAWLQPALSVRNRTYRSVTKWIGNATFGGIMAYRLFEGVFAVGVARRSWDTALQMLAIDAQVFGLVGIVVWGVQLGIGRQRPSAFFCATQPGYRDAFSGCTTRGDNRSLISGHVATAVAGAAVTCLHHARLPIYSERGARTACGVSTGMVAVTTAARWTTDFHWPTDVLLGGALGVAAGWVLPRLLHYGWDEFGLDRDVRRAADAAHGGSGRRASRVRLAMMPVFFSNGVGWRVRGTF